MTKNEFLEDICKNHLLGEPKAYVWVTEFQKRGLPHIHMLVWLKNKVETMDDIDHVVSAEIPDEKINPELFKLVKAHHIHGPCNANSVCFERGKCKRRFPKDFCNATIVEESGYPNYCRRSTDQGGNYFLNKDNIKVDNQWVVPFNPYLLSKYGSHMNIEICSSFSIFKYLFKYVYKGPDQINIKYTDDSSTNVDEIATYTACRYVGPFEAMHHIFSFSMQEQYLNIIRLKLHLPTQQNVYYEGEEDVEMKMDAVEEHTQLLDYFQLVTR
jgi:hypothetical protein